MPRIEVQAGALSGAAGVQDAAAGALTAAAGALQAAAASAAGAAGDGGAPAAIGGWGEGWSAALDALGSVVGGTAANVAAAETAYAATDSSAMPAGKV
jgi:hypothetical protein